MDLNTVETTSTPTHRDELLNLADGSMYRAKQARRKLTSGSITTF